MGEQVTFSQQFLESEVGKYRYCYFNFGGVRVGDLTREIQTSGIPNIKNLNTSRSDIAVHRDFPFNSYSVGYSFQDQESDVLQRSLRLLAVDDAEYKIPGLADTLAILTGLKIYEPAMYAKKGDYTIISYIKAGRKIPVGIQETQGGVLLVRPLEVSGTSRATILHAVYPIDSTENAKRQATIKRLLKIT